MQVIREEGHESVDEVCPYCKTGALFYLVGYGEGPWGVKFSRKVPKVERK